MESNKNFAISYYIKYKEKEMNNKSNNIIKELLNIISHNYHKSSDIIKIRINGFKLIYKRSIPHI